MSIREPGESGNPGPRDPNRMHRLAYLMLAPTLGRRRRAKLAEQAVHRAAAAPDPLAALVTEVLHNGGRTGITLLVSIPRPLRPETGDVDRELGALMPAARVACVLQRVADVDAAHTAELLRAAGVTDPETALASVDNGAPDADALRAVVVPFTGTGRARLVAAGVAVVVLGVAAPVIAVSVTGDHSGRQIPDRPVSDQQAKVAPTQHHKHRASPAPTPTPTNPVAYQLSQLLDRLDERLANTPADSPDIDQLRALRDAVAAQLKVYRSNGGNTH
ncbi:MAG TPA: hypothetical protein VGJ14_16995 [Sporichthyaceae bacterium]